MSVLVGTQEVLKLQNKEPGKARPANRDQSAVEGCPRAAYGCIGGLLQTTPCIDWPGHLPGGRLFGNWPSTPRSSEAKLRSCLLKFPQGWARPRLLSGALRASSPGSSSGEAGRSSWSRFATLRFAWIRRQA